MADTLTPTWGNTVPDLVWSRLGGIFSFSNGKGGVGKSGGACHVSALIASDGARVLLIDLNGQGNDSLLLGVAGKEGDDKGRGLFQAITAGAPLTPMVNVGGRQGLDLVPGGTFVRKIGPVLQADMGTNESRRAALISLALAIQHVSDQYDVIIIDTPPENPVLLQLALVASRFVIAPLKTSNTSRAGLRELATEIRGMREHNPYLSLLGAYMFGTGTNAKNIRRDFGNRVITDLGSDEYLMESFIRHAEPVADQIEKYGLLAHELEPEIANNPKYWEIKAGTATNTVVVSPTTAGVASDYADLSREILTRAAKRRELMMEEGMWP